MRQQTLSQTGRVRLDATSARAGTGRYKADAGQRILLMIGNPKVRSSFRAYLAEQRLLVYATDVHARGIRWGEAMQPDLIVSDLLLPGTRIAAPHLFRRRGSVWRPIIVGLTSSQDADEALRQALSYDLLLPEPIPAAVFTKQVLRLLA